MTITGKEFGFTNDLDHIQTAKDWRDAAVDDGWSIKKMEESLIKHALIEFEGNRSRAARELGINRTTLYNKLKVYETDA